LLKRGATTTTKEEENGNYYGKKTDDDDDDFAPEEIKASSFSPSRVLRVVVCSL